MSPAKKKTRKAGSATRKKAGSKAAPKRGASKRKSAKASGAQG